MRGAQRQRPEIDTCVACGKFFPRVYVRLCGDCVTVENHRFDLVREFLRANQGASISDISEATGLSRGDVSRFQTDGRLVEADAGAGSGHSYCTCAASSRRCEYCRRKLMRQFEQLQSTSAQGSTTWIGDTARPRGSAADPTPAAEPPAETDGRVHYVRRARRRKE